MEKQIQITVTETAQLSERIIDFFKQFGFKSPDKKEGILKFKQNSSLLDAWKTNPLKWGSEISISIIDNKVIANIHVDEESQMKTKEEEAVWQSFVENFENFLTNGKTSKEKLISTITDNKKSRLTYITWTFFGTLIGGILSILYNKITGHNSTFSIFLIPVFATLFLGWRINYIKSQTRP